MSDTLWHIDDRCIRSKSAAQKASSVAAQIKRVEPGQPTFDEQTLFLAMNACAYQANRLRKQARPNTRAARTWEGKWQTIRSHIVDQNLGLAYAMIGRSGPLNLDPDDRHSDALFALTRAVDRFNPCRGYRFSTYACNVIGRGLLRSAKEINRYRRIFPIQHDVSFERPEVMEKTDQDLYLERLNHIMARNAADLTQTELDVLARRFPRNGESKLTFQEIGDTIGLSKERVRQITNIALDKLRGSLLADPILQ